MNLHTALNQAHKELEKAKAQAAGDEKLATQAWQTAKAAKLKLKHARRLAKFTKKAARLAEDKGDKSHEALDIALARVEKLERRLRKQQKKEAAKPKPVKPARHPAKVKSAAKPKKKLKAPPAKKPVKKAAPRRVKTPVANSPAASTPTPAVATASDTPAPSPADPQTPSGPAGVELSGKGRKQGNF